MKILQDRNICNWWQLLLGKKVIELLTIGSAIKFCKNREIGLPSN